MDENQTNPPVNKSEETIPAPQIESGFKGSEVPPQPEKVTMRTMAEDMQKPAGAGVLSEENMISPEEFQTAEPVFKPETINQMGAPVQAVPTTGKSKKFITILGMLVGAAAVGVLAYFVVYPKLFPALVPQPEPQSPAAENTPSATETQTPEADSQAKTPLLKHESLFAVPAAAKSDVTIYNFSLSGIGTALREESANKNGLNRQIKEVAFGTVAGPIAFSDFLSLFVKTDAASAAAPAFVDLSKFEDDFTAFLYYDEGGVWPGYVARLRAEENPASVMTRLIEVESSLDLPTFYLNPAGTFKSFKDGAYNGLKTRYAVGGAPGASFNYTFSGNNLVLSTSFEGLKAALALLGQ